MKHNVYDAVIIGSGPNGLAAGITLAEAGKKVLILEESAHPGGGARSEELTLPGFVHDLCSAVHPLAIASPFFRRLPLGKFGLRWLHSPAALAHPFDNGTAVTVERSVEETAAQLGSDEDRYISLFRPLVRRLPELIDEILRPPVHWPKHPFWLLSFGNKAVLSADGFARVYKEDRARSVFLGIAAHSSASLLKAGTAGIGLALNLAAHGEGWPIPQGGAERISRALIDYFLSLGGELRTSQKIASMKELPESRRIFFSLIPNALARAFGFSNREPAAEMPGVFKMDWALSGPIPWQSSSCRRAITVHLGGGAEEIRASENRVESGSSLKRPFVLLTQPSLFDPSRAPAGKHTAWAYCHVPHAYEGSLQDAVEDQIERFAPGFRKLILARHAMTAMDVEAKNQNLVGGNISGGRFHLAKILLGPRYSLWNPYRISSLGYFDCSSATPPGPAVHGMCGYNAALSVL